MNEGVVAAIAVLAVAGFLLYAIGLELMEDE